MDNNGCPTQVVVTGYVGKRIIMQLMFSLFGNNEIASLGLFLTVFGHQFHYSLKTEHCYVIVALGHEFDI